MYSAITHDIEVRVTPTFMENESRPDDNHFFWAYQVTIRNDRPAHVMLVSRYWRIVDGHGRVEEVRGNGVVGEQPLIHPGTHYRYTSGCPLTTSHGIMSGHYMMRDAENNWLEIKIPAFSLDLPGAGRILN